MTTLHLQRLELFRTDDARHLRPTGNDPLNNHKFVVFAGVVNQDFHHEAVHLGFRQRVCAFRFNRVLSGHDQKRRGHAMRLPSNGDLPFLHHFQ